MQRRAQEKTPLQLLLPQVRCAEESLPQADARALELDERAAWREKRRTLFSVSSLTRRRKRRASSVAEAGAG